MAASAKKSTLLDVLMSRSDIVLALGVIAIIGVLVIPIPTGLLDFALAFNITFSLVVLLTTLYIILAGGAVDHAVHHASFGSLGLPQHAADCDPDATVAERRLDPPDPRASLRR
jgi:hypothetical protein